MDYHQTLITLRGSNPADYEVEFSCLSYMFMFIFVICIYVIVLSGEHRASALPEG